MVTDGLPSHAIINPGASRSLPGFFILPLKALFRYAGDLSFEGFKILSKQYLQTKDFAECRNIKLNQ